MTVITWACADTAGLESQDLDRMYLGAFVHAPSQILETLGSLRRVLPQTCD